MIGHYLPMYYLRTHLAWNYVAYSPGCGATNFSEARVRGPDIWG